ALVEAPASASVEAPASGAPSFSMTSTATPSTIRSRTAHRPASVCRSTLVVASRTTQASADCTGAGSCPPAVSSIRHSIPAAESTPRAPTSSVGRSASR
ncbi:hypothetical protein CK936_06925, partial [Streptomyces albireticuli]